MENEAKPQGQVTIKFGKGLIGRSFTSKSGVEMLQVKIPNRERTDKMPWETFAVPAKMIHDNQYGKDMITLFTCHPYASGGRQRYLVFCERTTTD